MTYINLFYWLLIMCCGIIDLKHISEMKKQMKNFSRDFMHTVKIYGSEHLEIQHYVTFNISEMCRYSDIYFDIDIEPTTIYIKLLKYQYIFGILHITTMEPS